MSLFDMFKDKATELLQGAKDKVSELTGIELPTEGVTDQVGQAAGGLTDTAEGAINGAKDKLTGH